jgi:hypothetical protein
VQPRDAANPGTALEQATELERKANQSTAGQWQSFTRHREVLTELLLQDVRRGSALTLCVLGAGNCNDLDLPRLLEHYAAIHLLDLDASALQRALLQQGLVGSAQLTLHAGVDFTGALDKLPRWARLQVTPEEMSAHPGQAARDVGARLGQKFDRVLSPCVWTQFQLHALRALGARHRLLELTHYTLGLTHLRVLDALLAPGGRALLATELTANTMADLSELDPEVEPLALLQPLVAAAKAIAVAIPEWVLGPLLDDPQLQQGLSTDGPVRAWLWSQGPERSYLTYACWLKSKSRPPPPQ